MDRDRAGTESGGRLEGVFSCRTCVDAVLASARKRHHLSLRECDVVALVLAGTWSRSAIAAQLLGESPVTAEASVDYAIRSGI